MKKHFLFCALLLAASACKTDTSAPQPEFESYASIKSDDWKSKIGQQITVEGYLWQVSDNIYKIVNDSTYLGLNTILKDENYLLVQTAPSITAVNPFAKMPELNGARVKATGTLTMYQPKNVQGESLTYSVQLIGEKHLATVLLAAPPVALGGSKYEMATQNLANVLNLQTIKPLPANRTKFALLYSGGIDAMQAAPWYYNNIQTMYNLLLTQGYVKENIVVVYKEGYAELSVQTSTVPTFKNYPLIKVDFAATPSGFNSAIELLKIKMKAQKAPELFVMTTNHGGGVHAAEGKNYSGRYDANNDEPAGEVLFEGQKMDEVISYYNSSQLLTDDDFAVKINSLPFAVLKCLFLQCFSGGFIHDLKGPNRVLMSATSAGEYSWGGGSRDLDQFFYHFINPVVNGPKLATGNFYDLNKDGVLTLNEIFNGAVLAQDILGKAYPVYKTTPQYDDDGDGLPNAPTATGLGSKLTL
ncbi:MAG: hypothetical protein EAZ32_14445 [Cytophagia bacterium]|nr:MAG: hypothetical protein EAZ38_15475 [Cytophagales bacterium]TAG37726.1 MAG: hypothetical protein EAZ32_14445 [Cytophagia bacterium]TAG71689.1 MAG: hypothetical protein EAZ26_04880 [Runella slithyformis]TAG78897.1 MAG: hypothetical protein EAZ22_12615 [Cytophagales bacterium]